MKNLFFAFVLIIISCLSSAQESLPLIPKPKSIQYKTDSFKLNSNTIIQADSSSFEAKYIQQFIKQQLGLNLEIKPSSNAKSKIVFSYIFIEEKKTFKEWYNLSISKNEVEIKATESNGIFYGIQTLLQIIPFEIKNEIKIPCLNIVDEPKFQWRGMHLDVCRHFFPVDFIKKYVDYLAMYKMNTFHWHLTDDQGWRIEIKKYPKLQEISAWRDGSMVGHYNEHKFDTIRYGGYYTQDEIKEVVAYAKQRHITIVPEIEMPGHAQAALAAYPEFSCTGKPIQVAKEWGVLEDVFCPKEETFTFLKDVLTEVMELFPSKIIHIGGDECPKVRWKNCNHCQNLIKSKGLKDEHELQSYFIQRIEKFLNAKGRTIIGWDEILEGGLAPNAAVMSWRGTQGGIEAAKAKHYVVMSPGSHCYFDHYQGEPKNEPIAIGGFIPIEKVYSFNPIPKELTVEESKYILGAQANLWSEYISTPEHVEYMIMPRMAALSEVVWGTSNSDEYNEFRSRLLQHFTVYNHKNINYSKAIYEVTTDVKPSENGVQFILKGINSDGIRYTVDRTEPKNSSISYTKPISITKNTKIKAAYFENGSKKSNTIEQDFTISKATGKKINLTYQPHENYSIGGAFTLVDGMQGNLSKYGRDWLGFLGTDLEATIDLEKQTSISKVGLNVLESQGSWIYYPKSITFLYSVDGEKFQKLYELPQNVIVKNKGRIRIEIPKKKIRFVKVIVENNGIIQDGKPGAGSKSWLFVDEILID